MLLTRKTLQRVLGLLWLIDGLLQLQLKESPTYEQAAAALRVSVGAVKTLIHRLRKRYTASVREEIGRTVSNPAEIDAEIHELCEALVVAEGWILP
jgi:hypothetical protein